MAKIGWLARFFRWLSDFFRPGDYDRDLAKVAYKAYSASSEVESLNTAIEHFQVAVDQYRKHNNPALVTTLINYAIAVWRRYEGCGRSPTDLDSVIQLDTEARDSWSGEQETTTYVTLLNTLARAYFEQYREAIGPEEKQKAFENAVKHYTKLESNGAVTPSQRITSQIQLGVIYRLQCELDRNLDELDIGIGNLKKAKVGLEKEVTVGDQAEQSKAWDEIMATCLWNLATSYEVRYELVKDSGNMPDLKMAIDYNIQAKPLLQDLGRPELSACLYNLARHLRFRWMQTNGQQDYDMAIQMAHEARELQDDNVSLIKHIDDLLGVLQPESRQGTRDSEDMGGPSQVTVEIGSDDPYTPWRQGNVLPMNI